MARQATPTPAHSPAERPEEDGGEEEGEVSEVKLELEPAEEVGLAWPNAVEDAMVAIFFSSVRHRGWRTSGGKIRLFTSCDRSW